MQKNQMCIFSCLLIDQMKGLSKCFLKYVYQVSKTCEWVNDNNIYHIDKLIQNIINIVSFYVSRYFSWSQMLKNIDGLCYLPSCGHHFAVSPNVKFSSKAQTKQKLKLLFLVERNWGAKLVSSSSQSFSCSDGAWSLSNRISSEYLTDSHIWMGSTSSDRCFLLISLLPPR